LALHETKVILNIFFDGIFNGSPKSGIHRYFYNIIKNLPKEVHKYSSNTETASQIPNHFVPYTKHFRPHKLSFLLEYIWFRRQSLSVNFDLVHSAYYNLSKPCRDLIAKDVPHVITVHDLIHELFDQQENRHRETRIKILENSKAIICVSHNTKRDLVKSYPSIEEKKVFAIHHGLNHHKKNLTETIECKTNYLLYVGHREGYKNFQVTLPALNKIKNKYPIELFVVGPEPTNSELQLMQKYKVHNIIKFKGKVSDETLGILYANCLAFLYPSLYEGFGYPLIESMSRGAIPIASNSSCIPEVLGRAGVIVEPNCSESIAIAVDRIIENENYKKSLRMASFQRSKKFSIDKQIHETINVYEKVLSNKV
jgi:glycosyltransferase involved in cell wall biosynthesis